MHVLSMQIRYNMNDNRKIQALMIYFKHWGIEEAQKHRRDQGIYLLMNKIDRVFFDQDNDDDEHTHTTPELVREIKLFNTWTSMANTRRRVPSLWHSIINLFLQNVGGYSFENTMKPTRESIVARHVNMKVWNVYDLCLSDDDLMSVDSIIALF